MLITFVVMIPSLIVSIVSHAMIADSACVWVVAGNYSTSYYNCNNKMEFVYVLMVLSLLYLIAAVVMCPLLLPFQKK